MPPKFPSTIPWINNIYRLISVDPNHILHEFFLKEGMKGLTAIRKNVIKMITALIKPNNIAQMDVNSIEGFQNGGKVEGFAFCTT